VPKKSLFHIRESRLIYSGRIIKLVKDRFTLKCAGNKLMTRELVIHPGAVVILPFLKKDKIVLLRQFRYAAKNDLWEIPAGTLEKNESPFSCAKRELEEETGFRARKFKRLTAFYSAPGVSNEVMILYRAWNLVPGHKHLDPDEYIRHRIVSFRQAVRMVERGLIRDAKTIVAILWAKSFR
jgi:ADP-ribose pyrophosphatase